MKHLKVFGLMLALLLSTGGLALAQDFPEDFFITAEIPQANAVSFVVSRVDSSDNFTPHPSTDLIFDMQLNGQLGIYLPAEIFAIDVATSGGAGNPDVLIEYLDTNNPNAINGGNGLAQKGVATVQKISGAQGSQSVDTLASATLADIDGSNVDEGDLAGGFMRVLVGIATGNTDPNNGPVDPAGAEPFTNADNSGFYTGTLTLTATLD